VSIGSVVTSGPLLLAAPVAVAAGAVTFMSPCCLPLVPGYLSYVTGMSGSAAQEALGSGGVRTTTRSRTITGAALFVLGFSVLFTTYGGAFGAVGSVLAQPVITQILGAITIVLGLMLAGAFERFTITGRIIRPSFRPRAGLAGAPLLGAMFGLGWTPCIGPTLQAVLSMGFSSGTAARGAFLAFAYSLGLGLPFLIVALAMQRGLTAFGFARRHARLIAVGGGSMLVVLGLLEVTGTWGAVIAWLKVHWTGSYNAPL
jgi:cytochrome c-type biogenesis protein